MNKRDAREIARSITNEEIQEMFDRAKEGITDWTAVSSVNPGLTKGTAWNILASNFDASIRHGELSKKNMIWEFGDYLDGNMKPRKIPKKRGNITPTHQEPIFNT
jgi:hypothetical protein